MSIPFIDVVVLASYLLGTMIVGLWASRRAGQSRETYFLAGHKLTWPFVGAAIFGSNISSIQLVGQAGLAFTIGLAAGNPQLIGGVGLLLLALFFIPVYLRRKIVTVPEFLEGRYGPESRLLLSVISIFSFVVIHISITLYAGALVTTTLLGLAGSGALYIAIAVIGLVAVVYAVAGGLLAVAYTDALRVLLLVSGGLATVYYGLERVGGWNALAQAVGPEKFELLLPSDHPDMPWTGVFSGCFIGAIYWACSDHSIVQPTLGAKNEHHARMGALFAAFLKAGALVLIVVPGIIASALFPDIQPDRAYPTMVATLLPAGISGLVLAGLLAAIMSTLGAAFCATGSLFANDIFAKIRPDASEQTLIRVSRVVSSGVFILGMLWATMMDRLGPIFNYLLKSYGYIAPPFAVAFLFGLFSRRATRQGGFWSICVGLVIGLSIWLFTTLPSLGVYVPEWLLQAHFWHVNVAVTAISAVVLMVVSAITKPPAEEALASMAESLELSTLFKQRSFLVAVALYSALIVTLYVLF